MWLGCTKASSRLCTGKEIRGQSTDPLGKMEIQKWATELVGGSKRKASFNTSPQITRCSVYHLSGLVTKGLSKTNNSGTQSFSRHFPCRAGEQRWAHPIEVPESHLPGQSPGDFVLRITSPKLTTDLYIIFLSLPSHSSLPCFPLHFPGPHNPDSPCRKCTERCLFFSSVYSGQHEARAPSSQRASPNNAGACYRRAGSPTLLQGTLGGAELLLGGRGQCSIPPPPPRAHLHDNKSQWWKVQWKCLYQHWKQQLTELLNQL